MKTRAKPLRPLLLLCGALLGATLAPLPLGAQEADNEGIQVHGQWVIEVRNTDGTLAERRAFQNALAPTGASFLRTVLTRGGTPGSWSVIFGNSSGDDPCELRCGTTEERSTLAGGSENLSVANTEDGIELSGSDTVDQDGQIGEVHTALGMCDPDVTIQDCDTDHDLRLFTITSRTLEDAPIDVTAGQSISVTVIISFN